LHLRKIWRKKSGDTFMQTFRILPAVAAIALCASTFSTRADDTPAQAAARAALMQDMNETGNAETPNPPPVTPPPPPPMNMETNMPVATPAPSATMPAPATTTSNSMWPSANTNDATANASLAGQTNGTNEPPATPMPPSPPPVPEQPVTAPSLPISASQQQQLQALLQQYVANQITPAQYQAERAKILAGQ
jgi:hypothetical protein